MHAVAQRLKGFLVVGLADYIIAQFLGRLQRVRHGFNAGGVSRLQLIDEIEHSAQALANRFERRLVDGYSRQRGEFLYLVFVEAHEGVRALGIRGVIQTAVTVSQKSGLG